MPQHHGGPDVAAKDEELGQTTQPVVRRTEDGLRGPDGGPRGNSLRGTRHLDQSEPPLGIAAAARLDKLTDPDPDVRKRAVESLGRIFNLASSVGYLRFGVVLRSGNSEARGRLDKLLKKLGYPSIAPALVEVLRGDTDSIVRTRAAAALGKLGDRAAVPFLLEALNDESEHVRGNAAWARGRIGDPSTVPTLIGAMNDDDVHVRCKAAAALGDLGDRAAIPVLLEALRVPNGMVRGYAATALGKIGDGSVVPKLIETLRGERPRPDDLSPIVDLVAALGELRAREAVPVLVKHLEAESSFTRGRAASALWKIADPIAAPALAKALRDPEANVRREAVLALGRIADPSSVPSLVQALDDELRGVRSRAAAGLKRIGTPPAIDALNEAIEREPALRSARLPKMVLQREKLQRSAARYIAAVTTWIEKLESPDPETRKAGLQRVDPNNSVPVLLEALEDADAGVREFAVRRLLMTADSFDVPAISKALSDPSPGVRSGAARTLGRIGGEAARQAFYRAIERETTESVTESIYQAIRVMDRKDRLERRKAASRGHPIPPPSDVEAESRGHPIPPPSDAEEVF